MDGYRRRFYPFDLVRVDTPDLIDTPLCYPSMVKD